MADDGVQASTTDGLPALSREATAWLAAEALAPSLIALARRGIPPDVQELLVHGDPMRGIPPGALAAAIVAFLERQQANPHVP